MPRRFRRPGGRGGRKGFYWDGLQFARTALTTTDSVFVLVDTTAQEFMPATVVTVRGTIIWDQGGSSGASPCTGHAKLMYVEVNDAQSMTGDHSAIDTHEEDIAQRQLWTDTARFTGLATAGDNGAYWRSELDVKAKIKLEPHGKKLLVLLVAATAANIMGLTGYIRVGLVHG